jgi:3-oxoacyl-[acyl-carrier protein] reductase
MTLDARGRIALITGGGTGMGSEIARALAERGADVAIGYARSRDEAEATADTLRGLGVRASTHQADLGRVSNCEALVHSVLDTYGRVDIVVSSAGTTHFIDFADLAAVTETVWDDIFDVNVKGAFFVARAAGEWMRDHGDGHGTIVNVASVAAFVAGGSSIPYSVSKAAVVHATRALATALAPSVRVNAVAPGLVLTRWWTRRGTEEVERRVAATRFGRPVEVQDVVDATLLLIGNESMSGQTIAVDLVNVMH